MSRAGEIAKRMTALRREALDEIADAGPAGLGFGRCSLVKRRELRKMGLTEQLPVTRSFEAVREILTPLGEEVRRHLQQQERGE